MRADQIAPTRADTDSSRSGTSLFYAAGSAEGEKAGHLLLDDGTVFAAVGLGPDGISTGELVFTTAMTGYQEALTDPSYRGQILMFTYPLIGNYPTASRRDQSAQVQPRAIIVNVLSDPRGSPREALRTYFEERRTRVLCGVDTRAITQHIRAHGAMPAALAVGVDADASSDAMRMRLADDDYDSHDFVGETTVPSVERHGDGEVRIALLDCGNKRRVVEDLLRQRTEVLSFPAWSSPAEILRAEPDGVVLSNGPGNPAAATTVINTARELLGRVPILGICLGHQVLALASGGETFKLPFGHRGANHPVLDLGSGKALITTQNHGYAAAEASLPPDLTVSHRHVNDGTVEGLRHRSLPVWSVQFHPEGAPGPREAGSVLREWVDLVKEAKAES